MNRLFPHHFGVAVVVHIAAYLHGIVYRALYRTARHSEEKVGVSAECLLIDEVAPASDALTYEQSEHGDVEHGEYPHLAQLADDEADHKGADYAAVYRKSAVAGVDDSL